MTMPLPEAAWVRFCALYERAHRLNLNEPSAMCLATADGHGRPSARIVLLKGCDPTGFIFYTNTHSHKGVDLAINPQAALCFFWDPLMEQVRIEGTVELVSDDQADIYFRTRSRNSQIGTWVSLQSDRLGSRSDLERRVREYEQQYADVSVPRPPHWSGYCLRPNRIEFWRAMPARLHDRCNYRFSEGAWIYELLHP